MAIALVEVGKEPPRRLIAQGSLERILETQRRFEHDLLTDFPFEGIVLTPDFVQMGIDRIMRQHVSEQAVLKQRQLLKSPTHPFIFFMREPQGDRHDLRYIRPNEKLIHSHPELNFPFEIAEGIGVVNGRIHIWARGDEISLPKSIHLESNTVDFKQSDHVKYTAAFTLWALDPQNKLFTTS